MERVLKEEHAAAHGVRDTHAIELREERVERRSCHCQHGDVTVPNGPRFTGDGIFNREPTHLNEPAEVVRKCLGFEMTIPLSVSIFRDLKRPHLDVRRCIVLAIRLK